MTRTTTAFVGSVAVVGVLLGVAGRVGAHLGEPFELTLALGMPWLGVAFAVGYAARGLATGALAGAAVLLVSVVAYYAVVALVERRSGPHYAAGMTVLWGFFGTLSGALFGLAGAAVRRESPFARIAGIALLAGALIGEAMLYGLSARGQGLDGLVLAGELSLGVALPFVAVKPARLVPGALAATAAVAFAALVADVAIRVFARAYGWGA